MIGGTPDYVGYRTAEFEDLSPCVRRCIQLERSNRIRFWCAVALALSSVGQSVALYVFVIR